jgi:hypothetical protein
MISAKLLKYSEAPCGARLITYEATYPLVIHAELKTHRALATNSASSRAIPTAKTIARVKDNPFVPSHIGVNQKGMQAGAELDADLRAKAVEAWLGGRDAAVEAATELDRLKVHKQIANRVLAPYQYITTIISATDLENLFGLRRHPDAEPHFQELAEILWDLREKATPEILGAGDWHLPLVFDEDRALAAQIAERRNESLQSILHKVSVGRSARVSYLTHLGTRDLVEDIRLHDDLMASRPLHASPAEHVAKALDFPSWYVGAYGRPESAGALRDKVVSARRERRRSGRAPTHGEAAAEACLGEIVSGNFIGFSQYRKEFGYENIGGLMP